MCFGKIEAFLYSHPLCPQKLSHPYGSRCREMQTLIGRPAIKGVHSEQQATDRHRLSHWGLRAGRPSQSDSCKGFPQRQHEKRRWLKDGKLLPKPRREQEGQGDMEAMQKAERREGFTSAPRPPLRKSVRQPPWLLLASWSKFPHFLSHGPPEEELERLK